MSDFNYEIETTNHYFIENITVDGKAVQDGTPTPDNPIDVQVVGPVNGTFGIDVNGTVTPIDLQGSVLASLPDNTRDVLTVDNAGHCAIDNNIRPVNLSELSWNWQNTWQSWYTGYDTSIKPSANALSIGGNVLSEKYANVRQSAVANPGIELGIAITTASSSGQRIIIRNGSSIERPSGIAYIALAESQTIDLGYIDVSNLKNIPEEIPLSAVSTLDPETRYSYINRPSYDVSNPYEDYNAPEYAYPPNHFGQDWETFDANDWNVSEMLDYTGQPESHAVYTVELCELMQSDAFNWKRPELDWSEAAYNDEQYERFCNYFEQRFMFREIGMLPPLQWFTALKRMLVYELMPKYKPLYAQVENGISPLGENEYYKERHVSSSYPETLLSGNSDYISSGEDREFERIKVDNAAEALEAYRNGFRSVDAALGDELEILFISMYTSFVNAF